MRKEECGNCKFWRIDGVEDFDERCLNKESVVYMDGTMDSEHCDKYSSQEERHEEWEFGFCLSDPGKKSVSSVIADELMDHIIDWADKRSVNVGGGYKPYDKQNILCPQDVEDLNQALLSYLGCKFVRASDGAFCTVHQSPGRHGTRFDVDDLVVWTDDEADMCATKDRQDEAIKTVLTEMLLKGSGGM